MSDSNRRKDFETSKNKIYHWILGERDLAQSKGREHNYQSLKNGDQFQRGSPLFRLMGQYAHRSWIASKTMDGEPSNQSRQQLAKHLAVMSFVLIDMEIIRREIRGKTQLNFEESDEIFRNLSAGVLEAELTEREISYPSLMQSIDEFQSTGTKKLYIPGDKTTWRPFIANVGISTMLLAEQMSSDELPPPGLPSGHGILRLVPDEPGN